MTLALALRYWKYGIMALLLALCAVQSVRLSSAQLKIAHMETAAVGMKASIDRQNEAVTRLQSASAHLIAKAQEARQNADAANAPLRDDVARIRAEKLGLGCATPSAIMKSGL